MKFDDIRQAYLSARLCFTNFSLERMKALNITVEHIMGAINLGFIEQAKDGTVSFSGSFCVVCLQPVVDNQTAVITVTTPRPLYTPTSLDRISKGIQRKGNKKRPRVYDLED